VPADWKKYEAAIIGSSAVESSDASQGEAVDGLIDPNTLVTAAGVFNQAQLTTSSIAENLRHQAGGLAGEGRPWQGAAADAFLSKMELLSRRQRTDPPEHERRRRPRRLGRHHLAGGNGPGLRPPRSVVGQVRGRVRGSRLIFSYASTGVPWLWLIRHFACGFGSAVFRLRGTV
jgi:hypothetical protein